MSNRIDKVLIIDDDEISNFITESILEQSNKVKEIDVVMSADEGIKLLTKLASKGANHLPSLILLDIKMPVKSGWDFLNEYKALADIDRSKIVIVMLSSSVYPDDVHKANTFEEVAGYLSKPITLDKVEEVVEKYMNPPASKS
jgi:CheY-like chemotaxis protein